MAKPESPEDIPLTSGRLILAVPHAPESSGSQYHDAETMEATSIIDTTSASVVNQTGANAGQDIVGRDKIEVHHHSSQPVNPLGALLDKLKAEVDGNQHAQACLAELQHYHQQKAHDGIVGLKAKLEKCGRADEYDWAVAQKEKFSKLLTQWSLYSSAQELFVRLLSRADYQFNQFIRPKLEELAPTEINDLFDSHIVQPTVAECAGPVLCITHGVAIGMVYWLAEQCFVRWHK